MQFSRNPELKKFAKKRESYRLFKAGIDCFTIHKEKTSFLHGIRSIKLNYFNFRSWILLIMILLPYKFTMTLIILVSIFITRVKKKQII